MEKKFERPELIIITFNNDDIITESVGGAFGTMAGDFWDLGEEDN